MSQVGGSHPPYPRSSQVDDPEADPERDGEVCQVGTFRYDGGSWSTVEDDRPCWE